MDKSSPEKIEELNRTLIRSGHAFDVMDVEIRLQDGKVRHYDLVRHRGAVAIIPVTDDGHILFVRQYRVGPAQFLLELPAGLLETGEPPALTAAREVREETGMAAKNIQKLGAVYLAPGYSSEYLHFFLATGLTPAPLQADEDEFLQVVSIPIPKAYEMALAGELNDSKTLAGLLLAQPHLLK